MLRMGTFSICIQITNDKFAIVQTHRKPHTLGLFSLHLQVPTFYSESTDPHMNAESNKVAFACISKIIPELFLQA